MSAIVAAPPAAKPRNRSIEARRAARQAKFERERLIVDSLNRGVPVAEIAARIGVTEKRMRAVVLEILARRMPEAPEDFAALQVSRLHEALLVAYSAMSADNLRAVGLVVKIVRELDRYHGFVPAGRSASRDHRDVEAAADEPPSLPASRPQTAPQAPEKVQSAPAEKPAGDAAPNGAGARLAPRSEPFHPTGSRPRVVWLILNGLMAWRTP